MMRPNWFIAFPVDLSAYAARISDPPVGNRRFQNDDLHITVAFLGSVSEKAAWTGWQTVCSQALPHILPIVLGTMRGMGNPKVPSAWSATLNQGAETVADWMTRLGAPALTVAGAAPERRPPLPHLTLARPMAKATDVQRQAGEAWALAQTTTGIPLELRGIALYTWSDDRRGTLFKKVAAQSFKP